MIKGIAQKYGYITDELIIQRKFDRSGNIVIIAGTTPTTRKAVYMISYIKEIIQMYMQQNYQISYREVKENYQNSEILNTYIAKNQQPVIKMMRRVHKKVKQEQGREKP